MFLALACNYLKGKHDICAVFWHPCWVILHYFCQYLISRVKDYIFSGLHLKVTDPDRGIHCIGKKQFEGTGNERDDKVVEWPKEG